MTWDRTIPLDRDGSPLDIDVEGESRMANTPFHAVGTYDGFGRGRSAAYFCYRLLLDDGRSWSVNMFMTDFNALLKGGRMTPNGDMTGTWEFVKRGQNFGIRFIE